MQHIERQAWPSEPDDSTQPVLDYDPESFTITSSVSASNLSPNIRRVQIDDEDRNDRLRSPSAVKILKTMIRKALYSKDTALHELAKRRRWPTHKGK